MQEPKNLERHVLHQSIAVKRSGDVQVDMVDGRRRRLSEDPPVGGVDEPVALGADDQFRHGELRDGLDGSGLCGEKGLRGKARHPKNIAQTHLPHRAGSPGTGAKRGDIRR